MKRFTYIILDILLAFVFFMLSMLSIALTVKICNMVTIAGLLGLMTQFSIVFVDGCVIIGLFILTQWIANILERWQHGW